MRVSNFFPSGSQAGGCGAALRKAPGSAWGGPARHPGQTDWSTLGPQDHVSVRCEVIEAK